MHVYVDRPVVTSKTICVSDLPQGHSYLRRKPYLYKGLSRVNPMDWKGEGEMLSTDGILGESENNGWQ